MWRSGVSQDTVLTQIVQAPLLFTPGSAYGYSNSNCFILGSVIESVTAGTYADYLAAHLFQPLGLTQSAVVQPIGSAMPYLYEDCEDPGAALYAGVVLDPSDTFAAGRVLNAIEGPIQDVRRCSSKDCPAARSEVRSLAADVQSLSHGCASGYRLQGVGMSPGYRPVQAA